MSSTEWFRSQLSNQSLWKALALDVQRQSLYAKLISKTPEEPVSLLPPKIQKLFLYAYEQLEEIFYFSPYGFVVAKSKTSGKGLYSLLRIAKGEFFGGAYAGAFLNKELVAWFERDTTLAQLKQLFPILKSEEDVHMIRQMIDLKSIYFIELETTQDKVFYLDPTDLDGVPLHPAVQHNVLQFMNAKDKGYHAIFSNIYTDPDLEASPKLVEELAGFLHPYNITAHAVKDIEPLEEILCSYGPEHPIEPMEEKAGTTASRFAIPKFHGSTTEIPYLHLTRGPKQEMETQMARRRELWTACFGISFPHKEQLQLFGNFV